MQEDITVKELKAKVDQGEKVNLIDVREPHEWDMDVLPFAMKISMASVPGRLDELKEYKDQELIINCRSGGRSGQITAFLRSQGFNNVRNLMGGMLAWKAEIDPDFNVV